MNSRERRILLVAGVAAGISAVFRTPLGAALLAVEFLYEDGFESDALIPSVLASVVSYSIATSIYGQTTLLGRVSPFPFVPTHLPLYAVLALVVSAIAALFVRTLRVSRRIFQHSRIPIWARPALGGLVLGVFVTPIIVLVGGDIGAQGQGLGLLGGGYGAVQMAISGSQWLPGGWFDAELLLLLAFAKLIAAALTIGSEGSAGDFAPSLAIGALLGGAFGRGVALLIEDARIQPGAFALVGMAVFYGGIAHVPLSALILTCELAGNYDLLVPLMLALGISIMALRDVRLYESQVEVQTDSPAHRDAFLLDVLEGAHVRDVLVSARSFRTFQRNTSAAEMLSILAEAERQDVFPVVETGEVLVGLVTAGTLRIVAVQHEDTEWLLATDIMHPPVSVTIDDSVRTASTRLISNTLRELPVVSSEGKIWGLLDETDITRWHCKTASDVVRTPLPISAPNWNNLK